MKALKIVGLILACVILLAAVLVGIAFVPAIQTWAVRKAVAGRPELKIDFGRVASGLSSAEIRDLKFEEDGLVVGARRVYVEYSAWDYLKRKRINLERVELQGLVIDTRRMSAAAPTPAGPAVAPAQTKPGFAGVLRLARLPFDVRLANLAADGQVELPGDRVLDFTLHGGGIETGGSGKIAWKVDFSDPAKRAPLRAFHANGSVGVHIAADRRIDLVELENTATAEGPKLPPDGLRIEMKAEQAGPDADEIYTTHLSLLRNSAPEPVFNSHVRYSAGANKLDGTWDMALHSDLLSALLAGFGFPEAAADGAGNFSLQPGTSAVVASGELNARFDGLERLNPKFPEVGPLKLHAVFDGAIGENVARLDRLEVELGTAEGRKLLEVGTGQAVSFDFMARRVSIANPATELAHVLLQNIPLAWAQSMMKPVTIDGGEFSAAFSIMAEAGDGQVHLRTIQPVSFTGVTLRDGARKLVEQMSLSLSPAIDYSPAKLVVSVPDVNLSMPAGDALTGGVNVEATDLAKTPLIVFSAQFHEKLVSVLRTYFPSYTGFVLVDSTVDGRLQGQKLQLNRFASSIKGKFGVLVTSVETLQPVTADLAAIRFTAANPAAPAARVYLRALPLSALEALAPKSKFAGDFGGATFEISLPSSDQVSVQTTGPVSFTGVALAVDGRSLVEGLDADVDLAASKRGDTISADVRRIEVRAKKTLLARLTGAGEVTSGEKLNISGKGRLKVDLGAVMEQPAFGSAPPLSRGNLTMDFDVASGDPLQARGNVTLRNLVARRGSQKIGDLDCQVDATLKADASAGTLKMPATLTVGGRCSDLNVDAAFSRAGPKLSFTGRLGSKQIVVDDLRALAALIPQVSAPAAQPGAKPANGNQAASSPSAEPYDVGVSGSERKAAAGEPVGEVARQLRDSEAFWKAIAGRFDADLKLVKIGGDYTVSDIRCAAGIDETRLALDNLEGKFNGNASKIAASVTFSADDPQPYALAGTVKIPAVDVGVLLRAANPDRAPALETTMAIDAKVSGRGATASDLANNICGQCDVTGSKGILRALGNKGQVAGGASNLLGFIGALSNSDATMAAGELAGILKEMPFDRFAMHVDRGADLKLKLTSLEFLSPMIHLTGIGAIQYKKGVGIADQPLHVEMQLAGKDQMELLLGRLYLLGEEKDGDGYTLMSSPFVIGGTPANPDSSQLWKIVGTASLKAAATRLIR